MHRSRLLPYSSLGMKAVKRLLAGLAAGLAIQPVSRGTTIPEGHNQPVMAGERELLEKSLPGSDHFANVRPEYLERYAGPKTFLIDGNDSFVWTGKALVRKGWSNRCLGTEVEEFVKARTR